MKRILAIFFIFQVVLVGCYKKQVEPSKAAFSPVQASNRFSMDDPDLIVTEVRREMAETTAALIALAADPAQQVVKRRKAIKALGTLGDTNGIAWLVNHITLRVPLSGGDNDEDLMKELPCFYTLEMQTDWRFAQAIMSSLDEPRVSEELSLFENVLLNRLGGRAALTMVVEELKFPPRPISEVKRQNLLELQRYLIQHNPSYP